MHNRPFELVTHTFFLLFSPGLTSRFKKTVTALYYFNLLLFYIPRVTLIHIDIPLERHTYVENGREKRSTKAN